MVLFGFYPGLCGALLPVTGSVSRYQRLGDGYYTQCFIFGSFFWPCCVWHGGFIQLLELVKQLLSVFFRVGSAASLGLGLENQRVTPLGKVFGFPNTSM